MANRNRAFTLLELLTVIAILTLLIGILIPSLSAARRTAKANVCLSHLKGIGTGLAIYLNENDDKLPPVRLQAGTPKGIEVYINDFQRGQPRWQWFIDTDLGPVINPTGILRGGGPRSRTAAETYFGDQHKGGTTMTHELFTCPSLVDEEFQFNIRDGAYGYNYQYLGNTRQDSLPGRWDNFPVNMHRIRSTANTVAMADSRGAGPRHGRESFYLDPPRMAVEAGALRFGPSRDIYDPGSPGSTPPTGAILEGFDPDLYAYSPVEARHNNLANVLFLDTHAEAKSLIDLGYEISGGENNVRKGTPLPIHHPESDTYQAGNRFFNGLGSDQLAEQHRSGS